MIIRSQDKKSITTDLNLHISECDFTKDNITYRICTSSHDCIGTYSTEKKAIKVLNMIENACRNIAFTDGIVFHMPQDSEV